MKSLQKLFYYQGKQVRTIIRDGQPWWVAKDVCDILDISNPTVALDRLDDDERSKFNLGRQGETNIINEPGLYSLIMTSRKPEAREFKRWVTHEVIPSIRQTGSYSVSQQYYIPETYSDALRLAADAIEENQRLKPKAEMHDLFLSASNDQPMAAVAKSLGVGRNKLFAFLRDKKVLRYNNEPFQKYMDRGYFTVVEKPITKRTRVENVTQTFVTAKGVNYIAKLLKQEQMVG